jgi:hypothetical protein
MQAIKEEYDDLTKITGIGPARKSWLAEVFGVRTYDDLAALSVDDIVAQFRTEGKPYSRSDIELWLQEAEELAAKKTSLNTQTITGSTISMSGNSPANESSSKEISSKGAEEGHWTPTATFIVEFQVRQVEEQAFEQRTKVNFHNTDQEMIWPGIKGEEISQWMLEQVGDKLQLEIQEAPMIAPETAQQVPLVVRVKDLYLLQSPAAEILLLAKDNGKRPHIGVIRADHPFEVKADFEVGETVASVIGKREIPYQAQFYTHNLLTGDKVLLNDAQSGSFSGGKASDSAKVSEITLSPGTYRLGVVVIAESEDVVPGYLELPVLRVV